VHLTLAGHYAVASSLFHAVEAVWPGRAAGAPPITAERCFERLGCSRWDVCLAYHETAKFLLGNATFSNHLHYSGWNTDVRQRYGAFIKTESWRSDPGLLDEAIGVYSNALAAQPGSWDLLRRLARAYATRKNYDAAIATGARAYALNPFCEADTTLAEAYRDRAAQRMDAGDPAGAADDLGMAITLLQRVHSVTNQARACALRAQALLKLKRFGEVVSSLDEALALQPGDADWHNARGFAHFQLQGQVYYNRAYAYASLKQYRKAAADVVAALQLNYPVEPQFVNFLKAKELEQKRRR
jgi:tetratricopeptide (TPR) repeat protein